MRNKIVLASLTLLLLIAILFFIIPRPNPPTTTATFTTAPAITVKPTVPIFTLTSTSTQPTELNLGTKLGAVSLDDTPEKVLQILGEPNLRTVAHGNGSPEWVYANGLTIDSGKVVWKIVANAPFQGATAEGFRLGDDKATYQRLYANFGVRAIPTGNYGYVHDASGVNLNIDFDSNGKAITIELDKDS